MTQPRRNILFITTDQQHFTAMGYLNPAIRTPNLDRLVARGMAFQRAYTVNPTCTPTRATLITGLHPSQHGAYSLGTKLMENVPTIGDIFDKHGHETALIGKAHFQPLRGTDEYPSLESYPLLHDLDFWRNFHGPFYGFRHVELARNHTDEAHVGQHYALWMEEKGHANWRDYFRPRRDSPRPGEPWEIPEEIHYNAWIAERTNARLEQYAREGRNFLLWASFFDPHPVYMVPEPYASMYDPADVEVPEHRPGEFDDKPPYFALSQRESPDFSEFEEPEGHHIHGAGSHLRSREEKAKNIATMYGMMTMLDKYVGRILDRLDELGLADNTLVCFTSDHGDFLGQHGLVMKAIHHYEDVLRVPLVASLPGVIPEGRQSPALQSLVDLPRTFLSFAGLPLSRRMAGVNQEPVWKGEVESLRDHVIVENQHQPSTLNLRTYIEDRYKVTIHYGQEFGELHDLEEDPSEYVNLWNSPAHQDLKRDLLLRFLHGEMAKAPLPMPRISGA